MIHAVRGEAYPTTPVVDPTLLPLSLAFGAYALLAAQDATVKWLVVDLPVGQVLFCRSVVVVTGCLAVGGGPLVRRAMASPVRGCLLVRGVVALAAWLCYFNAARLLPFEQLVTLWFSAPLFVVVFAVCFLSEKVGRKRWTAVAIGFAGTIVAGAGGFSISFAGALALLGAVLWAVGVILTRATARQESSLVQMLASNFVFLIALFALTAPRWHMPTLGQTWLCLLVGGLGGMGQLGLFEAFRRAPASLLAPVEYTALLWAFLLGAMVWSDVPAWGVFAGAALIGLAGLSLLITKRIDFPAEFVSRARPKR